MSANKSVGKKDFYVVPTNPKVRAAFTELLDLCSDAEGRTPRLVDSVLKRVGSLYDADVAMGEGGNAQMYYDMGTALKFTLQYIKNLSADELVDGNESNVRRLEDVKATLKGEIEKDFADTLARTNEEWAVSRHNRGGM